MTRPIRKIRLAVLLTATLCAGLVLGGCRKKPGEVSKSSGVIDLAAAKKIFAARCVACHGKSGKGNGPGAKGLKPPPRDYSDAKWQASVTDEQLKKTVLSGGLAVGKSALMPGNPDLKGKDAVLNGLVKIIRGFKR